MENLFWEKTYTKDEVSTFGNPSSEVVKVEEMLKRNSNILDMGCGDGRHSLYLAKLSHKVDAFDISADAINKINRIAEKQNIEINASVEDLSDYMLGVKSESIPKCYDLIIAHGLFQFVAKEIRDDVITEMKKKTNIGGYNIIAVFTDVIELPEDLKPHLIGVFKEGEVKGYYRNWEIINFESYIFEDEHEGGIKHRHAINKIVAKKLK